MVTFRRGNPLTLLAILFDKVLPEFKSRFGSRGAPGASRTADYGVRSNSCQ